MAPQGATLDKLFAPASGFGAVIAIVHASKAVRDKAYEQVAKRGGFTLNAIDEAKALARKFPGISDETLTAGTLSASPEIPDDDLDTIGLEWLLVAQSKMSATTAGDLARIVYENKSALGLDSGFATHIEPASVEKDAFVMAHQGAADYINDDTKSFMDKYSDMMYLGAAALSVIGSIFAAIYAKITRIAPEKASELSTAILDIGERIEHAHSLDQLECLQDELEGILRGAVIGLRDGTISTDGLDTFKLGYEFVRDEIGMRRDYLKRHASEIEKMAAPAALLPARRQQCRGGEDSSECLTYRFAPECWVLACFSANRGPAAPGTVSRPQPLVSSTTGERNMRLLLLIVLLGMLVAVGYFAYSAMSVGGDPIPTEGYVALALGAGFSVVVGIGLMMLLFLSSRRGYDEPPHFK